MHFGLTEEQDMIVSTVRSFVENEIYPHEAEVERTGEVPNDVAQAIKQKTIDLGFYACNFPESVGGAGLSHLEFALVERELGRGSMALNHFFGRPQNILMACKEDQIERYLTPAIRGEKMDALVKVGLGYIKVGQQATTLSGGEAQRVKLSKELARRSTGRTLYILDEPTTGLHFEDVRKLLEVLHSLVEAGNTVIVIEHNLDVIKTADWIIDIGPEGGDGGGEVVGEGTPEEIADEPRSHTGRYLKEMLSPKRVAAE